MRPTTDRFGNDLGDSLAYLIQNEKAPDRKVDFKGEFTNYVDTRTNAERSQEATTRCTVTYTKPEGGGTTTYDLGNIKWNSPRYEPTSEWEAHLCARGGEVLVITDTKAPWYARLFARMLGLEWQWVEVKSTNVFFEGYSGGWTQAGEDLPLGSLVVNNDGIATLPKPCSPEGCDVCRGPGHCNLFPECSPDCTEKHKLRGEET